MQLLFNFGYKNIAKHVVTKKEQLLFNSNLIEAKT